MIYAVNLEEQQAAVAYKNLDVHNHPDQVGEWTYDPDFLELYDIPQQLMCFSLYTWLSVIKPSLKKASREIRQNN